MFEAREVLACGAAIAKAPGGGTEPRVEAEAFGALGGGMKPCGRRLLLPGAVGGGRNPLIVEPGAPTVSHHATNPFPSTHLPSSSLTASRAESGDGTRNDPSESPFVRENFSSSSTAVRSGSHGRADGALRPGRSAAGPGG